MNINFNHFVKDKFDYLIIFLLFLISFYNNLLKSLFLVDYAHPIYFSKSLMPSSSSYSLFNLLFFPLSLLSLQHLAFQLLTLIAMLLSYSYIKKLIPKKPFIFAILFYFNPFVYSRIMVGQLGVLLAYLLLPVFIHYLFTHFENPDKTSLLKLSLIFAVEGLFQPQFFVLCLLLYILATIFLTKPPFNLKRYLSSSLILAILLILLSAFWLQGFMSTTIFDEINPSHAEFFSPKLTQGVPTIAKILSMNGFWRETAYATTYNLLPLPIWYALLIILILLALIGFYTSKTPRSKLFYTAWWIGILLATGISHPFTKPLFEFLFNHLPLFSGFRDSHKFVAIVALAYSYLCYHGIMWIRKQAASIARKLHDKPEDPSVSADKGI